MVYFNANRVIIFYNAELYNKEKINDKLTQIVRVGGRIGKKNKIGKEGAGDMNLVSYFCRVVKFTKIVKYKVTTIKVVKFTKIVKYKVTTIKVVKFTKIVKYKVTTIRLWLSTAFFFLFSFFFQFIFFVFEHLSLLKRYTEVP